MAQYRLLRNNKESGPYTKEQLIDMGLKAYDLVWADGKSAAWRYPSEIPELKPYAPEVEEQPFDRFYKKKEPIAVKEAVETITVARKEKPRFRVKADSRKVEPVTTTFIPAEKPVAEPKVQSPEPVRVQAKETTPTPDWKDVYNDWQSKTPAKPVTKQQPVGELDEEPVIETKFSQSLSSIKERYVEAVLKPKENAKATAIKFDKRYIAAAIAIPILCVAMWFGYKYSTPANEQEVAEVQPQNILDQQQKPVEQTPQQNEVAAPANDAPANNDVTSKTDADNTALNTADATKNKALPAVEKPVKLIEKTAIEPKKNITTTPVETKKIVDKAATEKSIATGKPTVGTTKADDVFASVPANRTTGDAAAKNTNTTTTVMPAAPRKASKKIEDYIVVTKADKTKGSVENMHLSVSNVTDFPIDLAVVDVEYFDANGKYQKGETVYVKNIPANNAVQVKVPDSKTSYSFNYKVSLISAEEKTLYLIAD